MQMDIAKIDEEQMAKSFKCRVLISYLLANSFWNEWKATEVTSHPGKNEQNGDTLKKSNSGKKGCVYSLAKFFHSLNSFIGIKFFFLLTLFFSIDLQVGAYGNLPFLKVNSTFGILSLVLSALVILFYIIITVVSARKLSVILEFRRNKLKDREFREKRETFETLRDWLFLMDELKPKISGIAAYFFQLKMAREIIAIFLILVFIQHPYVQIIPLIAMSLGMIILMSARNPFRHMFAFIINLILEFLYLVLFVVLLLLFIYKEKVEKDENEAKILGIILLIDLVLIVVAAIILFVFNIVRAVISIFCPHKLADEIQNEREVYKLGLAGKMK